MPRRETLNNHNAVKRMTDSFGHSSTSEAPKGESNNFATLSPAFLLVMARPIKETPILYGEEARKFETRMMNPPRLPAEQIERMQRDYEFMRSRCVNCTF